jgi:hypothetical protein
MAASFAKIARAYEFQRLRIVCKMSDLVPIRAHQSPQARHQGRGRAAPLRRQ